MDDNALADALARAERAIDRIEHASAATRHRADAGDALREREAALREKVRDVVAELDEMLGDQKPGQNPEPAHG